MNSTLLLITVGAVVAVVVARVVVRVIRTLAEWRRTLLVALVLAPVVVAGLALTAAAAVVGPLVVIAGVLLVAGGAVWWLRRGLSRSVVNRWARRARRTSGVATTLEVLRVGSRWAMRRRARLVRPSLAALSWRELRRLPATAYAVRLLRAGLFEVFALVEDVVVIFGGPRTGKTGWLAGAIIDAPGAVVVTSTRVDLLVHTRPLREQHGSPMWVFNPGGLGGQDPATGAPLLPSTVPFHALIGCESPVVATERAIDMIPEHSGGVGDRAYWDGQARRVLAAHLHAAALGERDMHAVSAWIADPTESAREVRWLLRSSQAPAFATDVHQFSTTNERTRSSITSTIMPALQWLSSPSAEQSARPVPGAAPLDVAELIRSRATVYLLGRDEAYTSPLVAALVGYICRSARRLASEMPGGRIDPTLMLALDEAGRAAPVPLDDWTGDAGGSGICIVAAFQSRADIVSRWGDEGAAKILNNAGAVLLYGLTKDSADLRVWSDLAGQRDETVRTRDRDGRLTSSTHRQVPVFDPARLSNLPEGRAVLFRRGMSPVVGRTAMAWDRRDVREAAARARFERTLDSMWASTAIAQAASVVAGAERLARDAADQPAAERPIVHREGPDQ